MISFTRLEFNDIPWSKIEGIGAINVFQTQAWVEFLKENQHAEPVIVEVKSDGFLVGYFTGLIVKKFGLRILGSPFRGWNTYFMGFNLLPEAPYHQILEAFPSYVFSELDCHYFEIIDPNLKKDQCAGLLYKFEQLPWFVIDLNPSEADLYNTMKSSARRNIRKSIKNGVTIEEGYQLEFGTEYHAQYTEVLKKRSVLPTYTLDTVEKMLNQMNPTGNLIYLRAINQAGIGIATIIVLTCNQLAIYWGGASWKKYLSDRPNEPLFWYVIKLLKSRGIKMLHLGGECDQFKEKLGGYKADIFRIRMARNILLGRLIDMVISFRNARFKNWILRRM